MAATDWRENFGKLQIDHVAPRDVDVTDTPATSSASETAVEPPATSPAPAAMHITGGAQQPGDAGGKRKIPHTTILVPSGVHQAVTDYAASVDLSATDVVMEAFNTLHTEFTSWFIPKRSVVGPMPPSPIARRRKPKAPQVNMYIYLTPEQKEVMDRSAAEVNAGSRSAFVTRLIEEFLRLKET